LGEIDIEKLHKIYRFATDLSMLLELPFRFKEDGGDYETAIQFKTMVPPLVQEGDSRVIPFHPPIQSKEEIIKIGDKVYCPDILDFENKIIIEYEEEGGRRRAGARLATKGHGREGDLPTKRDSKRDNYYSLAGFRVWKIYEYDLKKNNWKQHLARFLLNP